MTRRVLGLAHDFTMRRELVAKSEQIYFSDLSDADLSGLDLSGKCFTGCILTGCDLRGARLDGCRFESCFVDEDGTRLPRLEDASLANVSVENCSFVLSPASPWVSFRQGPWEAGTVESIRRGLRGDCEPTFEELLQRMSPPGQREARLGSADALALLALGALFLRNPEWEHRLTALSVLSRVLLVTRAPGELWDPLLTVLLYRTGDTADTVYFPALDLVKTFEPDESLLRHVLDRIESIEPAERLEALRGAQLLLSRYDCGALFPLEALERLLKDSHQPPEVLREALQLVNDEHEPLAFVVGEEQLHERLTPALPHLLKHGDEQVRKEALRAVTALRDHNSSAQVRALLHDVSPDIRSRAFMALYDTLPEKKLLQFLKDFPPNPASHSKILSHQAYLRGRGWSNSLIPDEELRPLLTSADPKARLDGLYYASLIGDPQYLPELKQSLRHSAPVIRAAALRAIEFLSEPPPEVELRFLESDPAEEVRTQLAKTLEALKRSLG